MPWIRCGLPALLATTACSAAFGTGQDSGDSPDKSDDPREDSWAELNLSCVTDDECNAGEVCEDNLCQPRRCLGASVESSPPLGQRFRFAAELELLVADGERQGGQYVVDTYQPGSTSWLPAAPGAASVGGQEIADIAAGIFDPAGTDGIVAAPDSGTSIVVVSGGKTESISVGFTPVAVAALDVDGDFVDEVAVASGSGQISICTVIDKSCERLSVPPAGSLRGLAAGDLDGDKRPELLIHRISAGKSTITGWWFDGDGGAGSTSALDHEYMAMSAGDVDGDGVDDVVFLKDGGGSDLYGDDLHVYAVSGTSAVRFDDRGVRSDGRDLAVGDLDADGNAEVVVLYYGNYTRSPAVELFTWGLAGLVPGLKDGVSATSDPQHIALADRDGDSVTAELRAGPELVNGKTVPTVVLSFPPFDGEHSDGDASVFLGDYELGTETLTDTVTLRLGVELGVQANLLGIFQSGLSATIEKAISRRRLDFARYELGLRLELTPRTDTFGDSYGGVVLASGCFDMYTYVMDDPSGTVGGDGDEFVLMVPVGGQTALWSTPRYNALAQAIGGLPLIEINETIGDPDSYPRVPTSLAGTPLSTEQMLFPERQPLWVSDVGSTAFHLAIETLTTNEAIMERSLKLSSVIEVPGITFGTSLGAAWGHGYAVGVGRKTLFRGSVPALPDDPGTPEDEYQQNAFGFSPVVYRQDYQIAPGDIGSFYAMSYVVHD